MVRHLADVAMAAFTVLWFGVLFLLAARWILN
jgi:hypothetical protein